MQKLVIFIDPGDNPITFHESWPEFLALAEKMPGLTRESTSHVESLLYGRFDYEFIHELYFQSMDSMKAALASPEGRAAGKKLQEITKGQLVLFYADHNEDSSENISQYRSQDKDAS
ncbi:MAG: EthD family reductase [Chloroflexi bacterium]|nr:MAG: EthD family reductase [Chloroflexota bacterium]